VSPLTERLVEQIAVEQLTSPRAMAFARYILSEKHHAFELQECRRGTDVEAIFILVRPEVPQRPKFDIRYEEPLAVLFDEAGDVLPEVLALRLDFPDVPHLNIQLQRTPKSLCLFAERAEELQLRWTPALLGERILWWLRETARGALHQGDQALEPFLGGTTRPLIIPPDIFSNSDTEVLQVYRAMSGPDREVLLADRSDRVPSGVSTPEFTLLPFQLPAQEHGVIRVEPRTLAELHCLCQEAGFDLLGELRKRLHSKISQVRSDSAGTILVLAIPKVRHAGGEVEAVDPFGFRCRSIPRGKADLGPGRLGAELGILSASEGVFGASGSIYVPLLKAAEEMEAAAARVAVEMLVPQFVLTPNRAAVMSGHVQRDDRRLLAVGLGALGSQVFENLARQGFGEWDLVDPDFLAPHNSVRHAVLGRRFGLPKAAEMANAVNAMFAGPSIAHALVTDVLVPAGAADILAQKAAEASVILDMSASVAVGRKLAIDVQSNAKRVALFLSPSGEDLVVMSEGDARAVPMDVVELQYLRAVLNDPRLQGHLERAENQVRYGGTCRDVSSRISQELAALHAAIGAKAVREVVDAAEPMLSIWRCHRERMTVERHDVPLQAAIVTQAHDWTAVLDKGLREKVMKYRASKLPKETCGILLGHLDTRRRRIYIVDALPPPTDSVEELDGCERGVAGLEEVVISASLKTQGQLDYLGEWHSHPPGSPCIPSERDREQMDWIAAKTHPEGKPAAILIACDSEVISLYITEP
jgi:proteasome lid subunit RPN8/RPN11